MHLQALESGSINLTDFLRQVSKQNSKETSKTTIASKKAKGLNENNNNLRNLSFLKISSRSSNLIIISFNIIFFIYIAISFY